MLQEQSKCKWSKWFLTASHHYDPCPITTFTCLSLRFPFLIKFTVSIVLQMVLNLFCFWKTYLLYSMSVYCMWDCGCCCLCVFCFMMISWSCGFLVLGVCCRMLPLVENTVLLLSDPKAVWLPLQATVSMATFHSHILRIWHWHIHTHTPAWRSYLTRAKSFADWGKDHGIYKNLLSGM
jgi:hypothetical protein